MKKSGNDEWNEMLQEYLVSQGITDEEDLEDLMELLGNNYDDEYFEKIKDTPLAEAYEILEKATRCKSKNKAIKLAKQAYQKSNECFDAIIFLSQSETNSLKSEKILNDGLEKERKRLEDQRYFDKENIGHFYGIFETRPYIRGLYTKAINCLYFGKFKAAIATCNEILWLNENDNTGARYLLMAAYAIIEDEKEMLKLYKKYNEECLEMLFPLMCLYYKIDDYKKAKEYLNKINKANPNLKKFLTGEEKIDESCEQHYYRKGEMSEVVMYYENYSFLLDIVCSIEDFILEK